MIAAILSIIFSMDEVGCTSSVTEIRNEGQVVKGCGIFRMVGSGTNEDGLYIFDIYILPLKDGSRVDIADGYTFTYSSRRYSVYNVRSRGIYFNSERDKETANMRMLRVEVNVLQEG